MISNIKDLKARLDVLDRRLGRDQGARKERSKLLHDILQEELSQYSNHPAYQHLPHIPMVKSDLQKTMVHFSRREFFQSFCLLRAARAVLFDAKKQVNKRR